MNSVLELPCGASGVSWERPHTECAEEHQYAIHEVYYDEEGQPESVTADSVAPSGETLEELQQDVAHYAQALTLPVLEYAQFEKNDA